MKNEILIQSPTRIDFAGGTLDCWPLNILLSPVTTINGAINIYTSCKLKRRRDKKIIIESKTTNEVYKFSSLKDLLKNQKPQFHFFKEIIKKTLPQYGFHLSAKSESPMGGGLGASSSLCVSVVKAFHALDGIKLEDHQLVELCSAIEARILNSPTGTQDYFPALKGGVNIIDYELGKPKIKKLSEKDLGISSKISLFFTGKSHFSGINNWEVIKKFVDGDKQIHKSLEKIKIVAEKTRKIFLTRQWEELPRLLKEEFSARKMLTEHFCSPEIEKLSKIAMKYGAEGFHICGAGGGGCVFIWDNPDWSKESPAHSKKNNIQTNHPDYLWNNSKSGKVNELSNDDSFISEKKNQMIKACLQAGFTHLKVKLV